MPEKKRRAGQPTKNTPEIRAIIYASLTRCPVPEIACKIAGISKRSYDRWRHTDKEFCQKTDTLTSKHIVELYGEVRGKDPWKLLKNVAKEYFKEHVELTHEQRRVMEIDAGDGEDHHFEGF